MSYNTGYEIKPKIIYENKKSYNEAIKEYDQYINFIDFDKQTYYGFNDKNGLEIVPKINKISIDNDFNLISLDFVIEAYKEMVDYYYKLLSSNSISKNSQINQALSKPAISLVKLNYEQILKNNYSEFNKKIVNNKQTNEATIDIPSYTQEYIKQILKLKSKSQTYIRIFSKNRIRNHNAITIDLIKQNLADDNIKINFINDINFPVLRKVCEQYGFYINKSIPWQLVANLSHPNILEKASKLSQTKMTTIYDILDYYYDILLFIDYEKQKEFFYDAYSNFYDKREFFTEAYFCERKQETKVNLVQRQAPSSKEEFLKTEELFFLKNYLDILNVESNYKYNIVEKLNIFKEAKTIYSKTLDKKNTLYYIRSQFYGKPNEYLSSASNQQNQSI